MQVGSSASTNSDSSQRLKICFVASTYPRYAGDGSGRFVQSMAEALIELGHEVHVVAPYHPEVVPFESGVHVHHFRYVWPDAASTAMGYAQAMRSDRKLRLTSYLLAPLFALAEWRALRRCMKREQFDVVHAHWVIPNAFVAARAMNTKERPLVISLHGSDIFFAQKQPVLGQAARWTFGDAAGVTACSPDLLDGAVGLGAKEEAVHLIPWGADPKHFAFDEETTGAKEAWALRHELGLGEDQPVILSLGRLVRKKGLDYLVRALPQIVTSFPNVRCVIAGDGPDLARLQTLARQCGVEEQIIFAGNVAWESVPAYLQMCTLFAVPSIHDENGNVDGLPTTILEAMAASRPIVASRVAGIPLAVADGKTGLLVAEKDVDALAAATVALLRDPALAQRYGDAGRDRVESELNWRSVAQKLEQIYLDALRNR